jgi:coenzyme PQQ precursor peptide PqqA
MKATFSFFAMRHTPVEFCPRLCLRHFARVCATASKNRHACCVNAPYALSLWAEEHAHGRQLEETSMAWTTPILEEVCIGLEINGYLPAEF